MAPVGLRGCLPGRFLSQNRHYTGGWPDKTQHKLDERTFSGSIVTYESVLTLSEFQADVL